MAEQQTPATPASATPAPVVLTPALLATHAKIDPKQGFDSVSKIKLSKQNIADCEDLSFCTYLKRIDIDFNALKHIKVHIFFL